MFELHPLARWHVRRLAASGICIMLGACGGGTSDTAAGLPGTV